MLQQISSNKGLFKTLFLLVGLVLLIFCFFLDVASQTITVNTQSFSQYYTFSGKYHLHTSEGDLYKPISDCKDSFCKTVKATPWLGGFALGLGFLVIFFQMTQDLFSGFLKKYHNWILQMVSLGLSWILILLIPILYIITKDAHWSLGWLALTLEFISVLSISFAGFLYYQANSSKGVGLLS